MQKNGKKTHLLTMRMDWSREMNPNRFLLIAVGVALVCLISCADTLQVAVSHPEYQYFSSAYEMEKLLMFDRYKPVLIAVLSSLYGMSYAQDKSSNYLRMILARESLMDYLISRVLATAIGTVLCCMVGFVIAVLVMFPVMPLSYSGIEMRARFLSEFCNTRVGALGYVLLLGCNFGLAAAALSIAGMWVSVYQPQGYIAVGSAVILFYFLYSISMILPPIISFDILSSRFTEIAFPSAVTMIVYHGVYLVVVILLFSVGFIRAVQRRWEDGSLL